MAERIPTGWLDPGHLRPVVHEQHRRHRSGDARRRSSTRRPSNTPGMAPPFADHPLRQIVALTIFLAAWCRPGRLRPRRSGHRLLLEQEGQSLSRQSPLLGQVLALVRRVEGKGAQHRLTEGQSAQDMKTRPRSACRRTATSSKSLLVRRSRCASTVAVMLVIVSSVWADVRGSCRRLSSTWRK